MRTMHVNLRQLLHPFGSREGTAVAILSRYNWKVPAVFLRQQTCCVRVPASKVWFCDVWKPQSPVHRRVFRNIDISSAQLHKTKSAPMESDGEIEVYAHISVLPGDLMGLRRRRSGTLVVPVSCCFGSRLPSRRDEEIEPATASTVESSIYYSVCHSKLLVSTVLSAVYLSRGRTLERTCRPSLHLYALACGHSYVCSVYIRRLPQSTRAMEQATA